MTGRVEPGAGPYLVLREDDLEDRKGGGDLVREVAVGAKDEEEDLRRAQAEHGVHVLQRGVHEAGEERAFGSWSMTA